MTGDRVGVAVVVGVVARRQETLIPIDSEHGRADDAVPGRHQRIGGIHHRVLIRRTVVVLNGVVAGESHIQ